MSYGTDNYTEQDILVPVAGGRCEKVKLRTYSDPTRAVYGPLSPAVAAEWEVRVIPAPFMLRKGQPTRGEDRTQILLDALNRLAAWESDEGGSPWPLAAEIARSALADYHG